jgi:hypothetical protein
VSADGDAMLARKRNRRAHHAGIPRMKSARHIRGREHRDQVRIVPDLVGAKGLADIAIQVNLHAANVSRTAV